MILGKVEMLWANQLKLIVDNARAYNPVLIDSTGKNMTYPSLNANYTMDGTESYINSGWIWPKGQTNNATITPSDPATFINQGSALYNVGRYNEAIQYFDKALSINPNDAYASTNKNLALSQPGSGITDAPVSQPAQQTQKIIPHEAVDSFKANGKIKSDIITSSSKWDATGDWNLVVED